MQNEVYPSFFLCMNKKLDEINQLKHFVARNMHFLLILIIIQMNCALYSAFSIVLT